MIALVSRLSLYFLFWLIAAASFACNVDDGGSDDDAADDDSDDDQTDDDVDDDSDDDIDDDLDDDDDDDTDDDADDDVDDDGDDDINDDADDDTYVNFCEDPMAQPDDTICDAGIRRVYCWFRAPIIIGNHIYTQSEATNLCHAGSPPPWDIMETCVDEIVLDMFAVWIAPFVDCLQAHGVGTPYSALFDPVTWNPPYPTLWNRRSQSLNFWTYWKYNQLHELSGAFTDVQGNSIHGSVSWAEIGYGYLGALFATGDSTVFNDIHLEIPMTGYIAGVFYIYPFFTPWGGTLTWTQ